MIFLTLELLNVIFIMLINVEMSTVVGILTFMNMINLILSLVEHKHSFIILRPYILFLTNSLFLSVLSIDSTRENVPVCLKIC